MLDRSIFSPHYRPGHWHLFCHHVAAACYQVSEDPAGCRAALERVGDAFDEGEEASREQRKFGPRQ